MTASLDFLERVGKLVRSGCGLVWVTHHLNDIPPETERVIVLKDGVIAVDGPKEAVLKPDVLSRVFETDVRVAKVDGYYFVYP